MQPCLDNTYYKKRRNRKNAFQKHNRAILAGQHNIRQKKQKSILQESFPKQNLAILAGQWTTHYKKEQKIFLQNIFQKQKLAILAGKHIVKKTTVLQTLTFTIII